jgi:hypothetical protein
MRGTRRQLRSQALCGVIHGTRRQIFLFLSLNLYRAFFGALLNRLLVAVAMGTCLVDIVFFQASWSRLWFCLQLLLWPLLMAGEEFLHILVFLQKRLPPERLDLVTAYRVGCRGRRWICYGGAVRYRGALGPSDIILISAPGPLVGLLGAGTLWLVISLSCASLTPQAAHILAMPTLLFLMSSLWLFRDIFPTDLANILKAKRDGSLGCWHTLKLCLKSASLIFSRTTTLQNTSEV